MGWSPWQVCAEILCRGAHGPARAVAGLCQQLGRSLPATGRIRQRLADIARDGRAKLSPSNQPPATASECGNRPTRGNRRRYHVRLFQQSHFGPPPLRHQELARPGGGGDGRGRGGGSAVPPQPSHGLTTTGFMPSPAPSDLLPREAHDGVRLRVDPVDPRRVIVSGDPIVAHQPSDPQETPDPHGQTGPGLLVAPLGDEPARTAEGDMSRVP